MLGSAISLFVLFRCAGGRGYECKITFVKSLSFTQEFKSFI
jgi:hypothetical protein